MRWMSHYPNNIINAKVCEFDNLFPCIWHLNGFGWLLPIPIKYSLGNFVTKLDVSPNITRTEPRAQLVKLKNKDKIR